MGITARLNAIEGNLPSEIFDGWGRDLVRHGLFDNRKDVPDPVRRAKLFMGLCMIPAILDRAASPGAGERWQKRAAVVRRALGLKPDETPDLDELKRAAVLVARDNDLTGAEIERVEEFYDGYKRPRWKIAPST